MQVIVVISGTAHGADPGRHPFFKSFQATRASEKSQVLPGKAANSLVFQAEIIYNNRGLVSMKSLAVKAEINQPVVFFCRLMMGCI
jgi:hypothetical protein